MKYSDTTPNPWKGLLAGAIGGFIASYVMSQFHAMVQEPDPPGTDKEEDATVQTASAVSKTLHHTLTPKEKQLAGPVVHYAFGSIMGAAYGAAVEASPMLQSGWGVPFGAAVWLGAHVMAVPALGLSKGITKSSSRQETVELGAHFVYGATAESIRRLIRTPTPKGVV